MRVYAEGWPSEFCWKSSGTIWTTITIPSRQQVHIGKSTVHATWELIKIQCDEEVPRSTMKM